MKKGSPELGEWKNAFYEAAVETARRLRLQPRYFRIIAVMGEVAQ